MDFIPHVITAEYVHDYTVKLRFNDGIEAAVDLRGYTERGGVFEPLRNVEYLSGVRSQGVEFRG